MNFINITNATGSSGNKKYISQYKINDKQNRLIGYSKLSLDVEANYLLEIIIVNKRYEFYHEILRQNLYKFINLVNKNGAKLNVIIPANVNASRIIKKALHLEEFQPARNNSNSADKYQYTLNISKLLGANNHKSISNANTRIGKARTKKQEFAHDTTKSKKTKKSISRGRVSLSLGRQDKQTKYEKTFILNTPKILGFIYTPLQEYMHAANYLETTNTSGRPFLLWIEMMENFRFDTKYFDTRCYLMNLLENRSKEIICNKQNLYFNFNKFIPAKCREYMAESWELSVFIHNQDLQRRITENNEVFIVRPAGVGAWGGRDIYVVNNLAALKMATRQTKKYNKVLISKYIDNPLLLDNRKFHVRLYFLVGLIDGYFVSEMLGFFKLFKAVSPYKKADWINTDIHDTHFRGNDIDLIYPYIEPPHGIANTKDNQQVIKNMKNIYIPKFKDCLHEISMMIKDQIAKYEQSTNAFEVFGCDFLITDDDNIVLMEINDKVEYGCATTEGTILLSQLYMKSIIDAIIEPLMKNIPITHHQWLFIDKIFS